MHNQSNEEPTLNSRLRAARARGFVGRSSERELFSSMLAGTDPGAVLWVHGPAGIGKSALLGQLADDAQAAGRVVARIDGRTAESFTPEAFTTAWLEALAEGVVVLVDTADQSHHTPSVLEESLQRDFLPGLPMGAVVVIASRHLPGPSWRTDPSWSELLRVISLGDLLPTDGAALLDARDVPPELRERVLAFANGNPLALALAAESARSGVQTPGAWVPDHDLIAELVSQLVGTVPSAAHRRVLEIAAHVHHTTEELLRSVLVGHEDPGNLFNWLRAQPFTTTRREGVYPHDVVREVVEADFRWRDPEAYEGVHRSIRRYLVERAQTAPDAKAQSMLESLIYLHRHSDVIPDYVIWQWQQDIYEDVLRPEDHAAVVAMTAQAEGEESAQIVKFWLSRQPGSFHVCRRVGTDEAVAFMAWLRLTAPVKEESDADPVVAAAWRHSRSTRPIRQGEHLAVARFIVDPTAYQRPSPVQTVMQIRILSEWVRSVRLAWSYIVVHDWEFWQPQMDYLDQQRVEAETMVGARSFSLYGHDWRAVPVEPWLDRHLAEELFDSRMSRPSAVADFVVLSQGEFDVAVRDALKSWRRPDQIATNLLTHSRLVSGVDAKPVEALRRLLAEAVDVLAQNSRTEHLYRAVDIAFFQAAPTQEAAAERLGLPLSTYRRHLSRGLEEVCALLWNQEVYGTVSQ